MQAKCEYTQPFLFPVSKDICIDLYMNSMARPRERRGMSYAVLLLAAVLSAHVTVLAANYADPLHPSDDEARLQVCA